MPRQCIKPFKSFGNYRYRIVSPASRGAGMTDMQVALVFYLYGFSGKTTSKSLPDVVNSLHVRFCCLR